MDELLTQPVVRPAQPSLRARLIAARWFWSPLLAFAVSRLSIVLIAYFSLGLIADSSINGYHARPDNALLDIFGSRWDTGFYLNIAGEGYRFQGVPLPSVAFFPLLPIMIRTVASAV